MTRSTSANHPVLVSPASILGQWRVDEATTIAHEAQRLGVSAAQMRSDLEHGGYLGVLLTLDKRAFTLTYDDDDAEVAPPPPQVASHTHAAGIPCGTNQLWLQFTWDDMIAQPFQYLLLTQHNTDHLEVEWPNDRYIHYRRLT